jgi:signal peptide peptidase SppA
LSNRSAADLVVEEVAVDSEAKERKARFVRSGEMIAMPRESLLQGPSGFFWLFGGGPTASERRGDVAIVHVRGALDHHADAWDDNYESILKRVGDAMSGQDAALAYKRQQQAHRRAHEYEEGFEPLPDMPVTPPSAVIMCIDSPGGVVSGLNETVFALQKMRKESGVPLIAYVNEMAASAAYALSCACDKILAPESAVVGSIGVISTMISQARKNEKDGYDVVLITSGDRKADGHVHAPITDKAKAAEAARVEKLAVAFFKLASKARGIPIDTIRGFQAGIWLGKDAERRKLVDEVISFDDAILALSKESAGDDTGAGGNETDRRAKMPVDNGTSSRSIMHKTAQRGPREPKMALQLDALIKKAQAALEKEKDPKKLLALAADLEAYKKTKKHVEHVETEEDDDPDDDEDDDKKKDDDDEDEESESKKSEEKHSEEEKKSAKGKEEDDEEEEEESKKASAALSLLESATGRKGSAAIGAAMAMFSKMEKAIADTAALKATAVAKERESLLERAGRYVPGHLLAALKTQKLAAIRAFVSEAEKGAPMVHTSEGDLIKPKVAAPGTEESLPRETLDIIDQACAHSGSSPEDQKNLREALVKAHLKIHNDRIAAATNGVGRY